MSPGVGVCPPVSISVFFIEVDTIDYWINTTVENCGQVEDIKEQAGNLNK